MQIERGRRGEMRSGENERKKERKKSKCKNRWK